MSVAECGVDGCDRPRERKGGSLCAGHRQQVKRFGKVTSVLLRRKSKDAFEGLYEAALAYKDELDTKTNEEFALARERYRRSVRRYMALHTKRLIGLFYPRVVERTELPGGLVRITFKGSRRLAP